MKTKASLQDILLHISKAVINIRNLEDFHRAIMDYIKPYVKFDDAVLVLLSEDRKTFTHPLTMSPKERVAHPNYNTVIHSEFKTTNTPVSYTHLTLPTICSV